MKRIQISEGTRKGEAWMKKTHYLRADLLRLLKGYPFYIAILGISLSFLFSLEDWNLQTGMGNGNVLDTYFTAVDGSGVMIAYAFCAFAYGTVFCEDLEKHYARYSIQRGSRLSYVLSKTFLIYVSSMVVMVLGGLLFVGLLRSILPWVAESVYEGYKEGMYGFLVAGEHYVTYIFLWLLQRGMVAGVLSLIASLVSTFISNKMLVLVTPILIDMVLLQCQGRSWLGIAIIDPTLWRFSSDLGYFLGISAAGLAFFALLSWGIYRRLKNRL